MRQTKEIYGYENETKSNNKKQNSKTKKIKSKISVKEAEQAAISISARYKKELKTDNVIEFPEHLKQKHRCKCNKKSSQQDIL